jgi:hypothetical protein
MTFNHLSTSGALLGSNTFSVPAPVLFPAPVLVLAPVPVFISRYRPFSRFPSVSPLKNQIFKNKFF